MTERKRWTASEERHLMELATTSPTLNACFMAVAAETGRTVKSVSGHYYQSMRSHAIPETPAPVVDADTNIQRRWTAEEDAILSRYIGHNITNLKACFIAVAEQINRTPAAVSSHWYTVLSKKEMHFACVSKTHVAKNRKNGEGVPSTMNIWQRFVNLLRSLNL